MAVTNTAIAIRFQMGWSFQTLAWHYRIPIRKVEDRHRKGTQTKAFKKWLKRRKYGR